MRPQALFANYLVCGTLSGVVIGPVAMLALCVLPIVAWHLREHHGIMVLGPPQLDMKEVGVAVTAGPILGAFVGFACAIPIWLVALFWPAAKHPVRAASVCASMSGTIMMLFAVSQLSTINKSEVPTFLVALCFLLIVGAIYGFTFMYLANRLEKFMTKYSAT